MKIVDKRYTAPINWADDPESYDERLFKAATDQYGVDEDLVIVNPILDDWVLQYADINITSRKVIVWENTWNNEKHWFIKKFPKGWSRASGWSKQNYDLNLSYRFDVIFISYDELNADENFKKLLTIAPRAKRIKGVKGIHQAHRAAAEIAKTDMVYIVDGDAYLLDDWKFDFQPSIFDRDKIFIWKSRNPINDLEYGYGGVKLFPRHKLLNNNMSSIDMTLSLGDVNIIDKVSNITAFATDPFSTWRSAMRECTKLMLGVISGVVENDEKYFHLDENKFRIFNWKSYGSDRPYGNYSIDGANYGLSYGIKHQNNKEELMKINDRDWLKERFKEEYPDADV
jgi:hypothetical protein